MLSLSQFFRTERVKVSKARYFEYFTSIFSHTTMHAEMIFLFNTVQLLSEYTNFHLLNFYISTNFSFNRRSKIRIENCIVVLVRAINFIDGCVTQTKENNYLSNIYEKNYFLNFYEQSRFAYIETGILFVTLRVERRS